MAVSVALGIVVLGWGFAAGAQVILFHRVYTVIGLGTSWLALQTSRASSPWVRREAPLRPRFARRGV